MYTQRMDDTRDITQYRQTDIDKQVHSTSPLEENPEGWKNDREDDFADVSGKTKNALSVSIRDFLTRGFTS